MWALISASQAVAEDSFNISTSILTSLKTGLSNGNLFLPFCLTLLAGFLTALSPCVYPLIPITLSIMGARKYESPLQGFLVAASYVLGMTLVYSTLGAVFAYLGLLAGSLMQSPVMLTVIGVFFIFFALSLFGLFDIVLPEAWLKRLSSLGGSGFRGAFVMGLVAGLIAAPCTGPILAYILTVIASGKNVGLGALLMASFSFGLGLPFLVLATFSSFISRLPKSGDWMTRIKYIFAALMLGTAFFYFSLAFTLIHDFLSTVAFQAFLVFIINIFIGLILILIKPYFLTNNLKIALQRICGSFLIAFSLAALLSSQSESEEVITSTNQENLQWHIIDDKTNNINLFNNLLSRAKKEHKITLIDFYADWCFACKELSHKTFLNTRVQEEMAKLFLIKIDASRSSPVIAEIQERYGVRGLPTVVFIDEAGRFLSEKSVVGLIQPSDFLSVIKSL